MLAYLCDVNLQWFKPHPASPRAARVAARCSGEALFFFVQKNNLGAFSAPRFSHILLRVAQNID